MKKSKGLFLFLSGVSTVGKTTTLSELMKLGEVYSRVTVDTTRALRIGEKDKRHLTEEQFLENKRGGYYWGTNFTHGNHYGSPKQEVLDKMAGGRVVLSDLDIDNAAGVKEIFPDARVVYLLPTSFSEIERRLGEQRSLGGGRLTKARRELRRFENGEFDCVIDKKIVVPQGEQARVAKEIHQYVQTLIQAVNLSPSSSQASRRQ